MRIDEFGTFPSTAGLSTQEQARFLCFGFDVTLTAPAIVVIVAQILLAGALARELSFTGALAREISLDGVISRELNLAGRIES